MHAQGCSSLLSNSVPLQMVIVEVVEIEASLLAVTSTCRCDDAETNRHRCAQSKMKLTRVDGASGVNTCIRAGRGVMQRALCKQAAATVRGT